MITLGGVNFCKIKKGIVFFCFEFSQSLVIIVLSIWYSERYWKEAALIQLLRMFFFSDAISKTSCCVPTYPSLSLNFILKKYYIVFLKHQSTFPVNQVKYK